MELGHIYWLISGLIQNGSHSFDLFNFSGLRKYISDEKMRPAAKVTCFDKSSQRFGIFDLFSFWTNDNFC